MSRSIRYTSLTLRLPENLVTALDDYADIYHITRSEALRRAIVALTGVLPSPKSRRADLGATHNYPATRKSPYGCPIHEDTLQCALHDTNKCESCACIAHNYENED